MRLERHFAPDDALSDVVHYLGTLPDHQAQESTQWELVEDTKAPPFWWCVGPLRGRAGYRTIIRDGCFDSLTSSLTGATVGS